MKESNPRHPLRMNFNLSIYHVICLVLTPLLLASGQSHIPEVRTDTLQNGMKLVLARVNDLPLIEMSLVVRSGSGDDPLGKEGLTHLMTRLLLAGTTKRSLNQMAADLTHYGSTLTAHASYESIRLHSKCLARNFPQTLDIIAEICTSAEIPEGAFERELQKLKSGAIIAAANTFEETTQTFFASLYGATHPLARQPLGSTTSLNALTTQDVIEAYLRAFRPGNITLFVSGNIDDNTARTIILDRLGRWQRQEVDNAPMPVDPGHSGATVLHTSALTIPTFRYGMKVTGRTDKNFATALLFNQILGGDSYSRLALAFWGERRIHPQFRSVLGFTGDQGYFLITGSSPVSFLDSTLTIIDAILSDLATNPVHEEELVQAKNALTRADAIQFQTNGKTLARIQDAAMYGMELEDIAHEHDQIMAVDTKSLQIFAGLLRASLNHGVFVIAGQSDQVFDTLQHRFGVPVRVIPSRRDFDDE